MKKNIEDIIYRIRSKIDRLRHSAGKMLFERKIRLSGNARPPSDPYISSDTFRYYSDHIFDYVPANTAIPEVKKGDIIFLNSAYMNDFFRYIHPKISNPYILITHDSVEPVDDECAGKIDGKIIHWFAKNTTVRHEKITPIPIGLENLCQYGTGVVGLYKKWGRRKARKKNAIFFKFNIGTSPAHRQIAYDYLVKHPLAETIRRKLSPNLYLKKLVSYKFTASPQGAGIQCHREWEAMYVGVVPIVERSISADYFKSLGLPMWVIGDWHELDGLTAEDLDARYHEIIEKADMDKLYIDYWLEKIKAEKEAANARPIDNRTV